MKIEVKEHEVIIPNALSKALYDFINTVNVPFSEKESLIQGLRGSVALSIKRLKIEENGSKSD